MSKIDKALVVLVVTLASLTVQNWSIAAERVNATSTQTIQPPSISADAVSMVLSQTNNVLGTANMTLVIVGLAVAIFAALMGIGAVWLQVVSARQRRKFLEEIAQKIASEEEIQAEIVAKLLSHKNAQEHLASAMHNIVERLVQAAVNKAMSEHGWDHEKSQAEKDIRGAFGVKDKKNGQ